MECVKLLTVWQRWCRRPSAEADAVGEPAPVVVLESEGTCSPAAFKSLQINYEHLVGKSAQHMTDCNYPPGKQTRLLADSLYDAMNLMLMHQKVH